MVTTRYTGSLEVHSGPDGSAGLGPSIPSQEEIVLELARIGSSATFQRARGLFQLLEFLVNEQLAGRGELLKETYVGAAFYHRPHSYDPQVDAVVRVSANRLRVKLAECYTDHTGRLMISVPRGGYLPQYEMRLPAASAEKTTNSKAEKEEIIEVELGAPVERPRWWRRRAALLLLGIELAGCLAALVLNYGLAGKRRPLLAESLVTEPLTPGSSVETDPAIAPDGTRFAYVSNEEQEGDYQIRLKALSGAAGSVAFTTGPGNNYHPAWSPDGKVIAYLHMEPRRAQIRIQRVDAVSSSEVSDLPFYGYLDDHIYNDIRHVGPAWLADGSGLIFAKRTKLNGPEHLVRHDLRSGQESMVTDGLDDVEDEYPSASPNGKFLCFVRFRSTSDADLDLLDLRTGKVRVLLKEWRGFGGVAWDPDGKELVASATVDHNQWDLWRVRFSWGDGPAQAEPLQSGAGRPMQPSFAQDGSTVAFTSVVEGDNLAVSSAAENGRASTAKAVFSSVEQSYGGELSPDGKRLAFFSARSGKPEIWMASVGADEVPVDPHQLTNGIGLKMDHISWSPDGGTIAASVRIKRYRVMMVDAGTGQFATLPVPGFESTDCLSPVWSRDGRWVYFAAVNLVKGGIWRASTSPVPKVELVSRAFARAIRIGRGNELYMTRLRGVGIWRVPMNGNVPGAIPQLSDVLPAKAWLAQDGALFFVDILAGKRRLERYDEATGVVTSLAFELPRIDFYWGGISYNAAARTVLYTQYAENARAQVRALVPRR